MPYDQSSDEARYYGLPRHGQDSWLSNDTIRDLKAGRIVPSDAAPTIVGVDASKDACAFALECLWAVLAGASEEEGDGALPVARFPTAMRAAGISASASKDICSALWVVWADIEGIHRDAFCVDHKSESLTAAIDGPGEKEAAKMLEVLKACYDDELVTAVDIFATLDLRMIHGATWLHVGTSKAAFRDKVFHVNIQKAVKITQFNAFREEPEGFAKLLTLLHNPALAKMTDVSKVDTEVMQLVGYFALSPLKVVYCILGAMEANRANCEARFLLSAHSFGPAERWLSAVCIVSLPCGSHRACPIDAGNAA
jgi:THO complex subunit 2 N-terminus